MTNDERDALLVAMSGKIDTVHVLVVGNGVPGLARRVSELESFVTKQKGVVALVVILSPILGVIASKLF